MSVLIWSKNLFAIPNLGDIGLNTVWVIGISVVHPNKAPNALAINLGSISPQITPINHNVK